MEKLGQGGVRSCDLQISLLLRNGMDLDAVVSIPVRYLAPEW